MAAGDLSLAYFGGLTRNFLDLLAIFGGLTKIYSSAYFGGLTLVLWVSCTSVGLLGWLGGFPGVLGWPSCLFLHFWLLWRLEGASACNIDRKFGGDFDGLEGNTVLLLHPAYILSLLV